MPKTKIKFFIHLAFSIGICCIVFLPWQIYILHRFPVESAHAFEYNRIHMLKDLGHPGDLLFHYRFLPRAYQEFLLPFGLIGIFYIIRSKVIDRKMTFSFLAMIMVIFAFFSLLVATKMAAFVYPVSVLIIICMAAGIIYSTSLFVNYSEMNIRGRNLLFTLLFLLVGLISLKPRLIAENRSIANQARNNKIHNVEEFRYLDPIIIKDYIVLNTRSYENIELMFYRGGIAYHWYPTERILDSLQNLGYKFAAFNYENDQQALPAYITSDSSILILKNKLK